MPAAGWPAQPTSKRSGLALASMICGIVGLVTCFLFVPSIVAIVLGFVATGQIKRSGGSLTGLGAARAGWITGLVGLLAGIGFVIAAVSGAFDDDDVAIFSLDVGDCVVLEGYEDESRLETLPRVDCDEEHDGEVVATGELNSDGDAPYPADAELFQQVLAACAAEVGDTSRVVPIAPDEEAWDRADGPYVCIRIV